jgi:hypothetical protein
LVGKLLNKQAYGLVGGARPKRFPLFIMAPSNLPIYRRSIPTRDKNGFAKKWTPD